MTRGKRPARIFRLGVRGLCPGCGVTTTERICHFCRSTVALIRDARCVSCTAPVLLEDTTRVEGRCAECRSRNVRLGYATRRLLHLAANARTMMQSVS